MGKKYFLGTTAAGCQCRHPTSLAGRTSHTGSLLPNTKRAAQDQPQKQIELNKTRCCLTALYPPLPFPDGFIIRIQFCVILIRQSWCVLPSAPEFTSELTHGMRWDNCKCISCLPGPGQRFHWPVFELLPGPVDPNVFQYQSHAWLSQSSHSMLKEIKAAQACVTVFNRSRPRRVHIHKTIP